VVSSSAAGCQQWLTVGPMEEEVAQEQKMTLSEKKAGATCTEVPVVFLVCIETWGKGGACLPAR